MVALNNLMPEDPEDRSTVEATLRDYPGIVSFIERLSTHVQSMYEDVEIHIMALHHDEWDPPLLVVTTASIPDWEYIDQLHAFRAWARNDPDYDATKVHLSLLPRLTSSVRP